MRLKPIPCNINVMEYTENYGADISYKNVAISTRKTENDILKDVNSYNKCTVCMSQEQYETIFEPLFDNIRRLNNQIRELNSK